MERVRDQPAPSKDHLCGFDDDGEGDDGGGDGDDDDGGDGGEYNDENQPVVGGRL